jgi:hypothetical protein
MRLRLVIAALAAALCATPAALASSVNPQTAGLQVALRAQGLYRGPIDAIAGAKTVAAVRAFQRLHHLPVTGLADARTRRQLGPLGRPLFGNRTLRRGDFGWDVAVLQFLLVRQGIAVPVNAYFDGPTRHGVRRLQKQLHLRTDGVVGAHTLTAIVRKEPVPIAHRQLVSRRSHARPRLRVHVVRKGDTLSGLARRYRTTVPRLARLNHLDPSGYLLLGTKLRIPAARHRLVLQQTAERTGSVEPVRSLLDHWAAHYRVDRHLVRALAWMESGYNNSLVSPAGARGIMQLLPTTWSYVETVLIHHRVRHDAAGNIRVGVALIHHLLRAFHGNEKLALAAWYEGEGAVREHGIYKVSRPFVANVIALSHRM